MKEIREKIAGLFEASKVSNQIPIYFTDTFELEELKDEEEMPEMKNIERS